MASRAGPSVWDVHADLRAGPVNRFGAEFLLWEFPLCHWLEQHGYDVTYSCNCDTVNADFLTRCRSLISVGHDEYWDVRQYHAAESAIDAGVNFLWLSGNLCP
ncbi:MAG: DUF6605 domain-containing protein [Planctomycetaceae bacterium]